MARVVFSVQSTSHTQRFCNTLETKSMLRFLVFRSAIALPQVQCSCGMSSDSSHFFNLTSEKLVVIQKARRELLKLYNGYVLKDIMFFFSVRYSSLLLYLR